MENTSPVALASNPLAYLTHLVAGSQRLLCADPIEQMELANAALDPVGQVYPWLDFYPLCGQTVRADGRLWIVADKERGPGEGEPIAIVWLVGCGHDDFLISTRDELRPVTWVVPA